MAELIYTLNKKRNLIKFTGLNNTQLIRAAKVLRFNNKLLRNNSGISLANKYIKSLERLKKLPNKNNYYARNRRLQILSNMLINFNVNDISVGYKKSKFVTKIKIPKLRLTSVLKQSRVNGSFSNNEIEEEIKNVTEFWQIIGGMGGFKTAYDKYQDDVERLGDTFGVDVAAILRQAN